MTRDPVVYVQAAGGRARGAAIASHCGRRTLHEAVRSGRLVRARRGLYALPALPDALALAAALGGVVSHASAAELMDVGLVQRSDVVHVTVPRGATRRSHPRARVHFARRLEPDDVEEGLTVPLRTLLDCASSMPFPEALAVADGMLAMRYVRAEEALVAAHASRGRGRAADQSRGGGRSPSREPVRVGGAGARDRDRRGRLRSTGRDTATPTGGAGRSRRRRAADRDRG